MKPIEFKHQNVVYSKDQPQYEPLPALKIESDNAEVISCWKMNFKDRIKVLFTGKVWLSLCSFNKPLTPSYMSVNRKELYSHPDDKIKWYKKIKLFKKPYITEEQSFISFYPKFNYSFYVEKAGYFDERPVLHTSITQLILLFTLPILSFLSPYFLFLLPVLFFGWGKLFIKLPIRTGIQDCDSAAWGVDFHNYTLWIYIGGGGNFEGGKKWWTWNIPFFTKDWVRTSILLKDDTWEHETKGNRKSFYNKEWKDKQKSWTYDYTDSYDGTVIPTTIYVEEREWRPKWLKWTSLFAYVRRTIDIHFSKEVGKRKGSWKGGTLGCGYTLLPNEEPVDCLKRMEKERKF